MNSAATQKFAGALLGMISGGMTALLAHIGYRTGLFDAATGGPADPAELAERAGLQERYVREWLGAMVCSGIMTYDPADGRYTLPVEHAALLTGSSAANMAPMTALIPICCEVRPDLERAFHDGGGIPYDRYQPAFVDAMDDLWRRIYDDQLISGFLAPVSGVTTRLAEGIDVLDISCGTGHAANIVAVAFPRSTVTGHDFSPAAIDYAERERTELGLANVSFAVRDIAELTPQPAFDLITAFDVIHDQRAPGEVLRRVRAALRPDGVFVMVEPRFSTQLHNNVGNPFAALCYAISLTHCMPVSLAQDGAGLGAVWGRELAEDMVGAAGFTTVEVLDSARPRHRSSFVDPDPDRRPVLSRSGAGGGEPVHRRRRTWTTNPHRQE